MANEVYEGVLIESPTLHAVRSIVRDYEVMLVRILGAMLDRYEKHPEYPFVDTKLDIFTGKDFEEPKDPSADIRGKTAIYGAIQGRGLEALVGHIRWLTSCRVLCAEEKDDWIRRLTAMVAGVFQQMEVLRAKNNGCVPFLMTPEGDAFTIGSDGRRHHIALSGEKTSIVDVFYAKGMLAAATLLGDQPKLFGARDLMRTAAADLLADWPNSAEGDVSANRPHGSGMLAIGAFALFAELLREEEWFDLGAQFVRHTLDCHVDRGQFDELKLYDHTEYIGSDGAPWRDDQGRILLDPGHCLEFVGLASKLLLLMLKKRRRTPWMDALIADGREVLPQVLTRSFGRGFNRRTGGIYKSVDLLSGSPINRDMPWWSLPETMRAAAELMLLCPSHGGGPDLLQIIADCSNAFVRNYVNRDACLMAYQTVDADGIPVDVIPLTSDLDPGYHTGLSIIDFLHCVEELSAQEAETQ